MQIMKVTSHDSNTAKVTQKIIKQRTARDDQYSLLRAKLDHQRKMGRGEKEEEESLLL
jgi:hypothetical protein